MTSLQSSYRIPTTIERFENFLRYETLKTGRGAWRCTPLTVLGSAPLGVAVLGADAPDRVCHREDVDGSAVIYITEIEPAAIYVVARAVEDTNPDAFQAWEAELQRCWPESGLQSQTAAADDRDDDLPDSGTRGRTPCFRNAEDFKTAVLEGLTGLLHAGEAPTQDNLARIWMKRPQYPHTTDKQISRWCNTTYGLSWPALVDEARRQLATSIPQNSS